MNNNIFLCLFLFSLSSCAHSSGATLTPYRCRDMPPTDSGQKIFLAGTISETKENVLHMDFDGFGVDFSSTQFDVLSPSEWKGRRYPIYFQEEELADRGRAPANGMVSFDITVPACLDQPWLFWEAIKPKQLDREAI
ncbi:hypothetical protein [Lysobacter sp. Root690]|uniref:hypothetical protein n=1 Tax=Lysobacter sp. Root690 TaxID=1736588 RepID=UPI0012FC2372|nr:hypothetical protein [Lysobacter sp. Root690]